MAYKNLISFTTYLNANFGRYRFRIMQEFVSKLLLTAIGCRCAVQFESEQTLCSRTGRQFRSVAALDRSRFGTCGFVPLP